MSDVAEEVRALLLSAGLVVPGEAVAVEPLGGGVSNDVYAVTAGGRAWVVKRALAKLRVAADWRSDIARIHREAACQRWLARVLPPGSVPAVLHEDHERHAYVMERAPLTAVNWKAEMLAGRVPTSAAERAGAMLATIHRAGREDPSARAELADQTVFDQLRLDPYLRTIAAVHPELAPAIAPLIDSLAASRETIVHGDYSPKNILLLPDRNILLDHEVAHTGDPCFDLGFFFCHLFLKALHVTTSAEALWAQIPVAWRAYRAGCDAAEEKRWLPYLGAMLLARVDGKSPAEYLTDAERPRVRALARPLLLGQVHSLDEAIERARAV